MNQPNGPLVSDPVPILTAETLTPHKAFLPNPPPPPSPSRSLSLSHVSARRRRRRREVSGAPAAAEEMGKASKGSRRGKKAWRANISTDDIEDFFEKQTRDAHAGAAAIPSLPSDSLFFVDKPASAASTSSAADAAAADVAPKGKITRHVGSSVWMLLGDRLPSLLLRGSGCGSSFESTLKFVFLECLM